MYERIEVPPALSGDAMNMLQQIWSYLFTVSEILNRNMQAVGGNELTDRERGAMNGILTTQANGQAEMQSLKDMVVSLAEYVKKIDTRAGISGITEEVESGRFGRYVQATEMTIESDTAGNTATDVLSNIIRFLKVGYINRRNYIYTGKLRTVSNTDIYGIAIGKDVVTFAQDGTETFNAENVVMEITDGKITLYDGGDEMLKIRITEQNSRTILKIQAGDDADQLIVYGDVSGQILNATTTETNFNNITEPGTYWISMSETINGPGGLTSGECQLEVSAGSSVIRQRLSAEDAIYTRNKSSGTWGSWYKYTGTAL